MRDIEFLEQRIEEGMIRMHEDNVEKIKNANRPISKKGVRSFLGLTGYYREFIPNYAAVASPLTDLTRKGEPNKIKWSENCEKAYQHLKMALLSGPILRLQDLDKNFYIED